MRPRSTAVFVTLMIIGIALPILYSKKELDNKKAIRQIWQQYQLAVNTQNKNNLYQILSSTRIKELDTPDANEQLKLVAAFSPLAPKITSIDLEGSQATAALTAEQKNTGTPGATITGSAIFILEAGHWKVDKVAWNVSMDMTQDLPKAAAETIDSLITPEAEAYLERMASTDIHDATDAWNDLGVLYMSERDFFKDYRAALYDKRTVPFTLVEDSWSGSDGKVFRYYTAHQETPAQRHTVGYALRAHLWRLDDGSGRGFSTLDSWWQVYEKANHLSEPTEVMVGRTSPAGAGSLFPIRDPKVPGSGTASVIIENQPYTFELATGFHSDTDLANPKQASMEYRVENANDPLDPSGNLRRNLQLILRFNASQTGFYITDQENISIQFRRGGQIFEPATACLIEVRTPYANETETSLSGIVKDCTFHSAGIDYHLTLMEFMSEGSLLARKVP